MLEEAGENLHQPRLKWALRLGDAVPRGHRVGARREFRVRGNPADVLLPLEDALAIGVPAGVELAFVFVRPFLEDVMRPVRRARRPIHQERLVGRERAMLAQPRQRLLRHVGTEVIGLVARRLDRKRVLEQARLILRSLARHEAVEIVEAVARRPTLERTHRGRFRRRRVVPFAERRGLVAVIAQHLRDRRRALRDHAGIAVEIQRALRDRARADMLVIAPGQQRCARRRADRRCVKLVERDALIGEARKRRRMNLAAQRVGEAEADIVEQHDQDVRRVGGKMVRLRAPDMLRLLQRRPRRARGGDRRKRQHRSHGVLDLLRERRARAFARDDGGADAGGDAVHQLGEAAAGDAVFHCSLHDRLLRRRHFVGNTILSCGKPLSSMSKSGSMTVLP